MDAPITVKIIYFGFSGDEVYKRSNLDLMLKDYENKPEYNYKFVTDPNAKADFYVIINTYNPNVFFEPERTLYFHNEPWCYNFDQKWGVKTWNPLFQKPNVRKYLNVFSPTHTHSLGLVQWMFSLNDLKNTEKVGNTISCIISSKTNDPGQRNRTEFIKRYGKSLNIHTYGTFNNNPLSKTEKLKGYLPYKYFFSVENNREPHYITEKFFEPILAECLVFYDGCPNITEYFDRRCFIPINLDDTENVYRTIKYYMDNDEYTKRLPYIKEAKRKIIEEYSFMSVLNRNIKDYYLINMEKVLDLDVGYKTDRVDKHTIDPDNLYKYNCKYIDTSGIIKNNVGRLKWSTVGNHTSYMTYNNITNYLRSVYNNFNWTVPNRTEEMVTRKMLKTNPRSFIPFNWKWGVDRPGLTVPLDEFVLPYMYFLYNFFGTTTFQIVLQTEGFRRIKPFLEHYSNFNFELYTPYKDINENVLGKNIKLFPVPLHAINVEEPDRNIYSKELDDVTLSKKYLFSFIGGHQSNYISSIRKDIFNTFNGKCDENISSTYFIRNTQGFFYNYEEYGINSRPDKDTETRLYNDMMLQSTFTLCPSGAGASSIRFYESLARGSIPVVFRGIDPIEFDIPCYNVLKDCIVEYNLKEHRLEDLIEYLNDFKKNNDTNEMSIKCKNAHILLKETYFG